jgi:F-type H+-transporting ATPase subunit epsilon
MSENLTLDIVTPDKLLLSEKVDIVVAKSNEGEFGVLRGHIPLITTLAAGELRYRQGNDVHYVAVSGGFTEVLDDKVTILAESAEAGRELDISRATAARDRAMERLEQARQDERIDQARAEAALTRALMRLNVAERYA